MIVGFNTEQTATFLITELCSAPVDIIITNEKDEADFNAIYFRVT